MMTTKTADVRANEDLEVQVEKISNELGLSIKEEQDIAFAISVATVDGPPPSEEAKRIIRLYSRGEIDYESAQLAIGALYAQ